MSARHAPLTLEAVQAAALRLSMRRRFAPALDWQADPALLATLLGLPPDPWQAAFLRATEQQILLNCCRQVGKSTMVGILAAHVAITAPPATVLLLSPSLRQSGQLFGKVKAALRGVGATYAATASESALSIVLANGSAIHSLPGTGNTVRGFSGVALVIVDEAAFVSEELFTAVSPMLAVSGGRLILLSTPFGKRGFFWDQWSQGGADWRRFTVTAEECPRIPAAFLDKERRKLGILYEQEYMGVFLDVQRAVFRYDDVLRAITDDVPPLFGREVA